MSSTTTTVKSAAVPVVAESELVFDDQVKPQNKVKVVVTFEATLEELAVHNHRLDRAPYNTLALPSMETITLNLSHADWNTRASASDRDTDIGCITQAIHRFAGNSTLEAMDKAYPQIAAHREMEELRKKAEAYDKLVAQMKLKEAEEKLKTEARCKKMVATKAAKKPAQ